MNYREFLEYLMGICDQSDEDGCSYIGAAWLRGLCQQEMGGLTTTAFDVASCPACGSEIGSNDSCLICQYLKEPRR